MPYVLVLDCGATNVRAGAVDESGHIVHIESEKNAAIRERPDKDWLVWDTESIWSKLLKCAARTVAAVRPEGCVALVVTAFSDDGAPVDRDGTLLYPVISWQCSRADGMVKKLDEKISPEDLYRITGEQTMPQHTLLRLLWLREYAPRSLEEAERYVMFPHILDYRLTGRWVNDPTTADSMFLIDIAKRRYSDEILNRFGFEKSFFPEILEPGQVIGPLLKPMAKTIGLKKSVPVIVGGHDTQFAVLGSGCKVGEMVLSSGTWEILFARTEHCYVSEKDRYCGLKNECDVVAGVFNFGAQWIGSGALEWLNGLLYPDIPDRYGRYQQAQKDAAVSPRGTSGVRIKPDIVPGTIDGRGKATRGGTFEGLTITTKRGDLYRAMLEALCEKLHEGVHLVKTATGICPNKLTVVGGGAKNFLLNELRAEKLGVPIQLTKQTENTLVGAAMIGFVGSGRYRNLDEASDNIEFAGKQVKPGKVVLA